MTHYCNEFDPHAAAWLRNLMAAGLIPEGVVDERSIKDLLADDVCGPGQRHFFCGIGGWPHALDLAGWPTGRSVWTGSCPCQPFSCIGKRRGSSDARDLWPDFRRLIAECRPSTVFGEQVAGPDGLAWLARVRADLEALDYAVGAANLCAAGYGAPHIRKRLYWVADANRPADRHESLLRRSPDQGPLGGHLQVSAKRVTLYRELVTLGLTQRVSSHAEAMRLLDGIPDRVADLHGYGNAIVPQVAAAFVRAFLEAEEVT